MYRRRRRRRSEVQALTDPCKFLPRETVLLSRI
jgi:hypothetical protein